MKNLIDELHKLDEYEYNVSSDFSKRVMKNIKKDKTSNKLGYVISLASVGMVACLAVILFNNSNIKTNFDNNMKAESQIYNSGMYDLASVDSSVENYSKSGSNSVVKDDSILETGNVSTNEVKVEVSDFQNSNNNALRKENSGEYFESIENLLKNAEYRYEKTDEGFEVRGTKDEINEILKDFINISIEEKQGYVLIRIK